MPKKKTKKAIKPLNADIFIPPKKEKKVYPYVVGLGVCGLIMALGMLERSRIVMIVGGAGLLIFLVIILIDWVEK